MKTVTTSSRNYNHQALQGAPVDDMEFVETLNLDPAVAYTPAILDACLDLTMQQNIDAGIDEKTAKENRAEGRKMFNGLLAKNGLL